MLIRHLGSTRLGVLLDGTVLRAPQSLCAARPAPLLANGGWARALKNLELPAPKTCDSSQSREYPQGESNPCCRTENPESWATRRWGPLFRFSQ